MVNLDGKVNIEALRAKQNRSFGEYLAKQRLGYLADWEQFVVPSVREAAASGLRYERAEHNRALPRISIGAVSSQGSQSILTSEQWKQRLRPDANLSESGHSDRGGYQWTPSVELLSCGFATRARTRSGSLLLRGGRRPRRQAFWEGEHAARLPRPETPARARAGRPSALSVSAIVCIDNGRQPRGVRSSSSRASVAASPCSPIRRHALSSGSQLQHRHRLVELCDCAEHLADECARRVAGEPSTQRQPDAPRVTQSTARVIARRRSAFDPFRIQSL